LGVAVADDLDEEIASDDDEGEEEDEFFPDGLDPFGLEAFGGGDWAGYELEDELDGLYYFDDDDVFDVEDLEAVADYEPGEEEEDDESLDDDDEVVFMGEVLGGAYSADWGDGTGDDGSLDGHDAGAMGNTVGPEEGEEADDGDDGAGGAGANLSGRHMPL
jgi:hypothetical protein